MRRHEKALETGKVIWWISKAWIGSTGEAKKRTEDDELEARGHLHEGSPDQNIDWKEWRDFTWINGYLIKKSGSLMKRVGGRENKGTFEGEIDEYLEEKTPIEIIEERRQRLRTIRMGTRLQAPDPRWKRVGGKRKQLRIELGKDEEAWVNLTRNAPDKKSWEPMIGELTVWP